MAVLSQRLLVEVAVKSEELNHSSSVIHKAYLVFTTFLTFVETADAGLMDTVMLFLYLYFIQIKQILINCYKLN